jgi:uncharacterized protein (TIGR02145 family)
MKIYILILSIWSLSLGISLKAQEEKILVIVNSQIYSGLQSEISRYINDISSDYSVSLFETTGGTAQDLKDFIISQSDSLVGCIFIGSMPVCWFEIDNDFAANSPSLFPCDLFYMDLDGLWSDEDNDGNYDSHINGTGDVAPEIFIGRIDASQFETNGENQIEDLRNYFDKDHNYWTGTYSLRKTGLTYTYIDWKNDIQLNKGMQYLYNGENNYQLINDDRVNKKDYLENRLNNDQYEFIQIAVHSSKDYHWFDFRGNVFSDDIRNTIPKALGYNLFACSACDYTQTHFLGGAYIFNAGKKSLVVIGSTKTGSMLQFYAFYQPLGENKPIGQAFKEWFNYVAPFDDYEKSWYYGMTIIGDPLIKFNSGSNNHGPIVDIGCNQQILWQDDSVEISGIIRDDGLPVGSQLTHSWENVSGPQNVLFDAKNSTSTSVHLGALGDYKIKLTASDGEYSTEDFKNIKVSRIKWQGETSRPANGMTMGLIVRDSLAYFTSTRDLVVANIKNKSNPFLISSFEFEKQTNVYDRCRLAVDSDYAYIASGQKSLYIIDISDPYHLQQIGIYSSNDPNECINDVKVSGNIAYIVDSIRGIVILDIHDRSNPKVLGYCPTPGTAEAVSVQGNYAYLNDGDYGLRIFDISDKSYPREIGYYNNSYEHYYLTDYKQNIQVIGNYAYISYQDPNKWVCISIIDISDKKNPVELCSLDSFYFDFHVEGNYLYNMGTCDHDVFGIFDITDKRNPKLIESYKVEEIYFQGNISIYKSNQFIYLGGQYRGRGLNIFKLHLDNTPPYVYAGEDQQTCNNIISLHGMVSDDNLPENSQMSYSWEKVSGPGKVNIFNPEDVNTLISFSDKGTYILRFSASDGELSGYDDIRINLNTPKLSSDVEVCENSQVPDLVAKGQNVKWYSDVQLTNLLHSGNTFPTGKTSPGTYKYYVTQSTANCETMPDTVMLTIKPNPEPPLSENLSFCENDKNQTLQATGENIKWYAMPDSLTDSRDGKKYNTTRIGNQFWMADNLDVGSQQAGSLDQTDNQVIEKYCYDDNPMNCSQYGGLYQWNELMNYSTLESNQGICPAGWHVPSNNEWIELETSLGMDLSIANSFGFRGTDQGSKLLAGGLSGFNALLAGKRTPAGTFASLNSYCTFWNSSVANRTLSTQFPEIYASGTDDKSNGFSLRCVRDDSSVIATGNAFNPGIKKPGIYSFQVSQTVNSCESPVTTVALTVILVPSTPVVNNITICKGDSVPDLTAEGENIQWYSDTGLTNLSGSGNSFTPGQILPGKYIYYVTQTIASCESNGGSVTLTINSLPVINLGADTTIYSDQDFILGPFTDDYNYLWSDGSENPYLEISGSDLGLGNHQIIVIVSDINSCNNSDTVTISVVPYSDIHYIQNNNPIKLFPNPTNGSFTIDLDKAYSNVNIAITEFDGRIIQMENYNNAKTINLKLDAEPGIYLVTITTINDRIVFKITKK